jgi:hypothetical protein
LSLFKGPFAEREKRERERREREREEREREKGYLSFDMTIGTQVQGERWMDSDFAP